MKKVDYLIVGQGLAGTLLAYELLQCKKTIYVVDNQHKSAASKVAAGLINPITGRRIVKSEQIDVLYPLAKNTYQSIAQWLGVPLWYDKKVFWSLADNKEENDWYLRASQANMEDYIIANDDVSEVKKHLKNTYSLGVVQRAAQVDLPLLISVFAEYLDKQEQRLIEKFDYDMLQIFPNHVQYKDIIAKKIIFCEGHQGRFNPFFKAMPFAVAKGDVLLIKATNLNFDAILKQQITICPLPNQTFWVGSNYEWNPSDDTPNANNAKLFEQQLQDFLAVPFQIVGHQAAIRPTMKNRQVVVAAHDTFPTLYFFNGLGTKGTSLAPYYAKLCAKQLLAQE